MFRPWDKEHLQGENLHHRTCTKVSSTRHLPFWFVRRLHELRGQINRHKGWSGDTAAPPAPGCGAVVIDKIAYSLSHARYRPPSSGRDHRFTILGRFPATPRLPNFGVFSFAQRHRSRGKPRRVILINRFRGHGIISYGPVSAGSQRMLYTLYWVMVYNITRHAGIKDLWQYVVIWQYFRQT